MATKSKKAAKEPKPGPEREARQVFVPEGGGDEKAEECVDKIDDKGHGIVWYPSGNVAINISIGDVSKGGRATRQALFMKDSVTPQVLVSFDQNGEGFVNYSNGKPWLIVSRLNGYQVSDKAGNIVMKGRWPREDATPIILEVTDSIRVEFINRQHIITTFELLNVRREFRVGEQLKRSDTYFEKSTGTSRISALHGKHELDVEEIRREHQVNGGSLYHRPGPRAEKTKLSGVGMLRTLTKELPAESEALTIIAGLEDAMQRMTKVNVLPAASLNNTAAELLEDMGRPPLTDNLKTLRKENFARRSNLQNWYNLDAKYDRLRRKIPSVSLREFYELTEKNPPDKVLVVVCFHASWSPMSRKHEGPIELAWGQLQKAAAKDNLCQDAMVQICRLDASEGTALQEKYQFRTVPMYLHFFNGKLVAATNAFKGKEHFLDQIKQSQDAAARGNFLPSSYIFGLKDNSDLDHINMNMSLLNT